MMGTVEVRQSDSREGNMTMKVRPLTAALIALGVGAFAASAAEAETYTFTAPTYGAPGGFISNWVPGACGAPN